VVVSAPRQRGARGHAAVWHDLECGSYTADLPLWLELATLARGPVLDIGAGTGRVARVLARAGHDVTAVEYDEELLAAARVSDKGLPVAHVRADARALSLERRDFGLCIVPMHTVQLLGPSGRRAEFLRRARAHLRPGGLLACAVLADAEPFDCRDGSRAPAPESVRAGAVRFVSAPVRVAVDERAIVIERERRVTRGRTTIERERDVVELARLSPAGLARELSAEGFVPDGTRSVPATAEHVGSDVVLARA
jgi:SAM-dependent methyltransferase